MPAKGHFTVTLDDEFQNPLKKIAKEKDRSVAWIVEDCLRKSGVLKKRELEQESIPA